jgi:DNA-binding PadR family transcriptional regulator
MILRLISTQPTWGYRIAKTIEANFNVKLGHGILYPLLNSLENSGFLQSTREKHGGRTRKIYEITPKGILIVDAYHEFLKEQVAMKDIRESGRNAKETKT